MRLKLPPAERRGFLLRMAVLVTAGVLFDLAKVAALALIAIIIARSVL
jgi:hypothetical protein